MFKEFALIYLIAFGCILRGEEIILVSLEGMLMTGEECISTQPDPYIMVTLEVHFKGENGLTWQCLPLATITAIAQHSWKCPHCVVLPYPSNLYAGC